MSKKFIVATRPSLLAFTQTQQTVALLKEKNPSVEFEILKISTHGDKVKNKPLTEFGGTGVFVKELENAILEGKAHFAVHSLKDVPSIQPEGLSLVAFPKREDARDVILVRNGQNFADLADNCVIGTGSPRRKVQVAQIKPKAVFKELRGNIDTRIEKLEKGEYDAIILAAAGLSRLKKTYPQIVFLDLEKCIPAVGQGAIALECKTADTETIAILRSINDNYTELAITAERSYMKTIGGGCKFPLGAHATIEENKILLSVMLGNHLTGEIINMNDKALISEAKELGKTLAINVLEEAKNSGMEILY